MLAVGLIATAACDDESERPSGCETADEGRVSGCHCCFDDERCVTENAVVVNTYCEPKPTLGPGEFECGSHACKSGDVCVRRLPAGDGSTAYECQPSPSSCDAVDCTCLEGELWTLEGSELGSTSCTIIDGHAQITGQ
jgi:hypothetical protein